MDDGFDFGGFEDLASPSSNAADFPPVPSGGSTVSDALGIFKSVSGGALDVAKSIADFQTAMVTSSTNAAIAKTNLQTQQTLSQLQAQSALAKAQAALKPASGLLPLLLIGGAIFALR
jgi:hypothetical protein